jgi:alpha-tubulin suppressor-like RCC1 family protein
MRGRIGRMAGVVACVTALSALGASGASAASDSFSWGSDGAGQLGNGYRFPAQADPFPAPIGALAEPVSIAGGEQHAVALLADGSVVAWGAANFGQLGDGEKGPETRSLPAPVSGITDAVAIAAGGNHSLAVLSDGTVVAWGQGEGGDLGDGSTASSDVPVPVSGLTGVKEVAAGLHFSLALLEDGTVEAWGEGLSGQLGNGTMTNSDVPVVVSGLSGVTTIAAGNQFALAVLASGHVDSWGSNSVGQLGTGGTAGSSSTPVAVSGLSSASAVAAGEGHGLALLSSGAIEAWGSGEQGQLGNGSSGKKAGSGVPVAVKGITNATAIAAGGTHSYALLAGGVPRSWGSDIAGALGDGHTGTVQSSPVALACGLEGLEGVASGKSSGYAWGAGSEACPRIASVTPNEGPPAGGTTVVIHGSGFTGATSVAFGGIAATSFTVDSSTEITAVTPAGTETVTVEVTTSKGPSIVATRASDAAYTYAAPPTITSLSPPYGYSEAATPVVIKGTNLGDATAVTFGGKSVPFTIVSSREIETTDIAETGAVEFAVSTPAGTTEATPADVLHFVEGPEFGRCGKGLEGALFFSNTSCTFHSEVSEGDQWEPILLGGHQLVKRGFTLTGGKVKLESPGGVKISCTAVTGSGEYTGDKAVQVSSLHLVGCSKSKAGSCQSAGASSGEVRTETLAGALGRTPTKVKTALEIGAAAGETVAEFTCGSEAILLQGAFVAEDGKENKMGKSFSWKATEKKGVQGFPSLKGGAPASLSLKVGAGAAQQAGLGIKLTETAEEELEINLDY